MKTASSRFFTFNPIWLWLISKRHKEQQLIASSCCTYCLVETHSQCNHTPTQFCGSRRTSLLIVIFKRKAVSKLCKLFHLRVSRRRRRRSAVFLMACDLRYGQVMNPHCRNKNSLAVRDKGTWRPLWKRRRGAGEGRGGNLIVSVD